GSRLVLHHRRSGGQVANQKWTFTKEGRIALRNEPYVLEVKDKHVVLADASKASKHPLASQFIIIPVAKGGLYDTGAYIVDTIKNAFTFDINKIDYHEKAEALIIVEESATPEKCKEIVSCQKDDGSIELGDTVCNDLDAPKEEIITTIQKNIKNNKFKNLPELPSLLSTAINLSYLKKAASKHEGLWRNEYNKAREYLSKQIRDANAEKELLECADNYVIDNFIKKVIKDKKKNAVIELQGSTTPEKCIDVVSNQKDDGLLECANKYVVDKIIGKVIEEKKRDVIDLKKDELQKTGKPGLMSGIYDTITYVPTKIGEIGSRIINYGTSKGPEQKEYEERSAPGEEEKSQTEPGRQSKMAFFGDQEERHKEDILSAIQDAASPEQCKEIVSKQKDDGSFELDDKLKLPKHPLLFSTAVVLSYLKKITPKHKEHWENQYNKGREYLSKQIGYKDAEDELLDCADKYVVDKVTAPEKQVKHYKTTQTPIPDKHIEDIICDDKELDQTEKEAAFDIVKESATPDVFKAITYTANDAGRIGLNEAVCKELDRPKEEIINTVQNKITNEKLKSPDLLSTAVILSCLKNAAPKFEGQWKDKYNKSREYLSKQIGDENAEKELLDTTDKYRSAVLHLQTSTTPDKYEAAVSKQKDDGSFELSETVRNELEVPVEDTITKVKSGTNNQKLQIPESEPWWKTALTMSYLKVAAPHHNSQWKDKFNKGCEYLTKQIGDENTRNELLECTDKYVIDRANDKAIRNNIEPIRVTKLDFTDDTLQKVHEGLRSFPGINTPDTARLICQTQKDDGSFTLNNLINQHLDIKSEETIESLKKFVSNPKLRGCDDSVWHTAFTIYYLKNILKDHENEWRDTCDRASDWLSKQINDKKLEKELYSACKQYFVEQGSRRLYSRKVEDAEKIRILKINVDEETRKKAIDQFSPNAVAKLCPLVPSPDNVVESLKRYVGSMKLRNSPDSIWHTAFIIYYLKNVLTDHEKEWRDACNRACAWITEQ
ncbi:2332_t:CDS:2, partial [Gigaspora rosea]